MSRRRPRVERTPEPMPPRKRDWKPGTYQLGVFVRTPNGSTLQMVHNLATDSDAKAVIDVMLRKRADDPPAAELTPARGGDAPDSFPLDGAPLESQAEVDSDWRKDT